MSVDYEIQPALVKAPDDTKPVEIDLYAKCGNVWRPNEDYGTAEFILPTVPNGFSYEITGAGRTALKEPIYPKTLGATVQSGSATLTCRASSAGGLNAISSPSAVSSPTGITISTLSVAESRKIITSYAGGTDGQDYDVVYTFTLDGLARTARHKVKIRTPTEACEC